MGTPTDAAPPCELPRQGAQPPAPGRGPGIRQTVPCGHLWNEADPLPALRPPALLWRRQPASRNRGVGPGASRSGAVSASPWLLGRCTASLDLNVFIPKWRSQTFIYLKSLTHLGTGVPSRSRSFVSRTAGGVVLGRRCGDRRAAEGDVAVTRSPSLGALHLLGGETLQRWGVLV